jgi:hypothetical protein
MRYKIIAAIGTLITIVSLDFASTSTIARVDAQSVPSNSETGNFTLSGESLQKVEHLSIKDDYREFFTRSGKQSDGALNIDSFNYLNEDDGVWEISDRLEILVNEPLSRSIFPFSSRENRSILIDNLNRFELQYELSEYY